jgi:hypothetical protein
MAIQDRPIAFSLTIKIPIPNYQRVGSDNPFSINFPAQRCIAESGIVGIVDNCLFVTVI